jgi:abortive infection Abi-like protein
MSALTPQEIHRLVNDYIGVEAGYLNGFSYSKHQEFYPYYCGLDIDPLKLEGMTTKQRFIHILQNASPADQAKILRGTLAKSPPSATDERRTPEFAAEIESWARRCDGSVVPGALTLSVTSDVVNRAISDAEILIKQNGATSGLDRIHTTVHGYLLAVCDMASIAHNNEANITTLFALLRQHHPRLQPIGPRADDVTKILRALAQIIDVLNPMRNQASLAHPNPELLGEDEAWLVINAARSFMHYVSRRLS